MISSEVQRTLVKSPPELWAELSDPSSLARHLGELGEVRITRAEPEKLVEWEAEAASGRVAIKASGWGTKVTLSASRELPLSDPEIPQAEDEIAAGEQAEATATDHADPPSPSPEAAQAVEAEEPAPDGEVEQAESEAAEPEAIAEIPAPEPEPPERRPGLFARLFGRGRRRRASVEISTSEAEPAAETAPPAEAAAEAAPPAEPAHEEQTGALESETSETAAAEPLAGGEVADEPTVEVDPPGPDLAAELKAAEEAAAEEVKAILTGVLDRLGAAHHRPFSRS